MQYALCNMHQPGIYHVSHQQEQSGSHTLAHTLAAILQLLGAFVMSGKFLAS